MTSRQSSPAIILVEPQLGENIGTAARAMGNYGLENLRLVSPRDGWPSEKAIAASSGATHVIGQVEVFDNFEQAIGDLNFVAATTARPRDLTKPVMTPEDLAREMNARITRGEKCGILFGREKAGLTNDHVALTNASVMIPVNPHFASLNIAQAVLLIGYEWLKVKGAGSLGREPVNNAPTEPGLSMRDSRPATKTELISFFEHLERELDDSGFLRPPEKRPVMIRNIRALFERTATTEQEIRTLRGIVASLVRTHKRPR